MKFFIILILLVFSNEIIANPFSAKSSPQEIEEARKSTEKAEKIIRGVPYMHYLGKLNSKNENFAIIIFRNLRYLSKKGEKIFNYDVIEVKNEYILLIKEGKTYRVDKE